MADTEELLEIGLEILGSAKAANWVTEKASSIGHKSPFKSPSRTQTSNTDPSSDAPTSPHKKSIRSEARHHADKFADDDGTSLPSTHRDSPRIGYGYVDEDGYVDDEGYEREATQPHPPRLATQNPLPPPQPPRPYHNTSVPSMLPSSTSPPAYTRPHHPTSPQHVMSPSNATSPPHLPHENAASSNYTTPPYANLPQARPPCANPPYAPYSPPANLATSHAGQQGIAAGTLVSPGQRLPGQVSPGMHR